MLEIKGKVNTAICYAKVIEDVAIEQIQRMCDYGLTEGSKIRIMPDVHAGKGCTVGTTMTVKDKACPNIVGVDIGCGMYTVKLAEKEKGVPLFGSDEFNALENKLPLFWQWNHNPDNKAWSLTDRPGWLRLKNENPAPVLESARNTLTQRVPFPWCACETLLDTGGMRPGDMAGISAFQLNYGYVGAKVQKDGRRCIVFGISDGNNNVLERKIELNQEHLWLKTVFDFRNSQDKANDLAYFMYSLDGQEWIEWNTVLHMEYALEHFSGYRIALYSYNMEASQGFADFDYLRMQV